MSFSAPFIRRPVGTSLLAAGIFVLGLAAYRVLPVAPIPRVDYPMISVSASLPGADPATVASSLAAPLERRLGQISGVAEMTSISTMSGCSITIQFDLNRNIDGAARDVQAAINAATGDLPINLPGPPTYRKLNPADSPIMMTTMAALLGALPLALQNGTGSELRKPLGIAIVGGLLLSQFLTLYTTPVIYLYLDRLGKWVRGWRAEASSPVAVPAGITVPPAADPAL